jgi:hypothetical protein
MDLAVDSRADLWAVFAGKLVSWSSNTTTMGSRLPDEKAFTWLGFKVEKLGSTLARAVEAVAQPTLVIAVRLSAAPPNSEATIRGVKDIFLPPFPALFRVPDTKGVTPSCCWIKG